jgi:hypothetical protein
MAWNSRYSLISHARSSLWTVLILSIVAAFVLKRLAVRIDKWMVTQSGYDDGHGFLAVSADEAHAILDRCLRRPKIDPLIGVVPTEN